MLISYALAIHLASRIPSATLTFTGDKVTVNTGAGVFVALRPGGAR